MGLCLSSGAVGEAARAAVTKDTALVLMPAGELREYPRPATAAQVLDDASVGGDGGKKAGWFLCDADGMGFEGPVSAVGAGEDLRAGQIYFVLPVGARRRGLSREEVAALAVRASAALTSINAASAAGSRSRGAVAPLVFAPPPEDQQQQIFGDARKTAALPKRRPVARRGRRLERFASDLTAIPECDMTSE